MIKVWGRRNSINVQKVLWALAETGQKFERVTVGGSFGGLDDKEFKKLNPMEKVPVIQDGTIKMFESNAIVRYVARRYGRGTLAPRGHKAASLAEIWTEWANSTILPQLNLIFMNKVRNPQENYDAKVVKAAEKNLTGLMKIANRMIGKKPFVAGKHFSYGDIVMGCVYWRYKNLDIVRPNLPNLDRWFESLKERPAYREWVMVPIGRNPTEWMDNEKKLK